MFTIIILIKPYVIMLNTINIQRHTRADTRVENTLPKMRRVLQRHDVIRNCVLIAFSIKS